MSELLLPRCANLEVAGFDALKAAEDTWEALLCAGVFVEGDFIFASGMRATLKADAEILYNKPKQLEIVLGHFASFPCVIDADVLLYVPDGMRKFMIMIGHDMRKSVVGVRRIPNATSKYDFEFLAERDKECAQAAISPLIGEDIVTTLGSVAAVRSLLLPDQEVHSLALLLRGTVDPNYQKGLIDHYLLKKEIPTDKYEFRMMLERQR
jgi:hypothetical protein